MAKTAANLAAKFVCDEAIQLLGGYGFSREYPVERTYRDIRGLCIGAGTVAKPVGSGASSGREIYVIDLETGSVRRMTLEAFAA